MLWKQGHKWNNANFILMIFRKKRSWNFCCLIVGGDNSEIDRECFLALGITIALQEFASKTILVHNTLLMISKTNVVYYFCLAWYLLMEAIALLEAWMKPVIFSRQSVYRLTCIWQKYTKLTLTRVGESPESFWCRSFIATTLCSS